ncbi:hypothetical protein Acsp02_39090 [Actinoplanes sp. NBRC 103695]|nr:hypothetical protein Acsp02_39090 [Actinoplanes sp. NBRC 103695]
MLLVSGGESLQGVANLLNDAGVPTPSETRVAAEERTGRWSKFMVRNVLTTQHGRRLAAALLRLRGASPLPDAQESDRVGQEGVGER